VAVIVNLGGEGEISGAINVNNFVVPSMVDRGFARALPPELVVRRSAHDTGLPDGFADKVVANLFPIQWDEFVVDSSSGERAHISVLAKEIVRILKPGGVVQFACSSCDRTSLKLAFEEAGLDSVTIGPDDAVEGVRS
jgi:hypothetical protein